MSVDPTLHPVFSVSRDHAVGAWRDVLVAYFPDRVTVEALRAVHEANGALRAMHPAGTTTISILRAGMPMPHHDARAFAAKIGREASAHLKGECIVFGGHPIWARMARSALRAIELVARPVHPRAVFDTLPRACAWTLERAGHPADAAPSLERAMMVIVEANERARRGD